MRTRWLGLGVGVRGRGCISLNVFQNYHNIHKILFIYPFIEGVKETVYADPFIEPKRVYTTFIKLIFR